MPKFRKKPIIIEAHQWYQNCDHPEDNCHVIYPPNDKSPFQSEGEVVGFLYGMPREDECSVCSGLYKDHGWIKTLEGGHIVCPGDWIITGVKGEKYPCKQEIFEMTYEKICDE